MNREIKFRAWDGKKFHYFTALQGLYGVLNPVVEQFVVIPDMKEKESYEGDIVQTEHGAKGVVEWVEDKAAFKFNVEEPMWSHPIHAMNGAKEIIGNIHENPELLK